jgi:hypothetical protein
VRYSSLSDIGFAEGITMVPNGLDRGVSNLGDGSLRGPATVLAGGFVEAGGGEATGLHTVGEARLLGPPGEGQCAIVNRIAGVEVGGEVGDVRSRASRWGG